MAPENSPVSKANRLKPYGWLLLFPLICFAFSYAAIVPIGQTPDEPAHLGYVYYLLRNHQLPTLYDLETAHHPPAYYLLLAPLLSVTRNPYCLRLFSLFLSLLNLSVINAYLSLATSSRTSLGRGTTLFVSLIPMYVFMSIAINNDSLSNLLASLMIYYGLLTISQDLKKKELLIFGLSLFVAVFTKVVLFPFVLISLLLLFWKQRKWRSQTLIFTAILVLFLSLFWFSRNVRLYGQTDLLGWKMLQKINPGLTGNRLLTESPRQWAVLFFHSFWGIFGWFAIYLPVGAYTWLRRMTLILFPFFLAQIISLWKNSSSIQRQRLVLLGIFLAATLAAVLRDNLTFFHPQGRYLFPVIGIIGFYYSLGIYNLSRTVASRTKKITANFIYYALILGPLLYLNLISLKIVWIFFQ